MYPTFWVSYIGGYINDIVMFYSNLMKTEHTMQEGYYDFTLLLPTLNEAENIEWLVNEVLLVLPGINIKVIDDNSDDETREKVLECSKNNENICLIARPITEKRCLTSSIQLGIDNVSTKYVAWMDADGSHPPNILKVLCDEVRRNDSCCIASRYSSPEYIDKNKRNYGGAEFLASALSELLSYFVKKIYKLDITDYTSGFIVMRNSFFSNEAHRLKGDYGEYFIRLVYSLNKTMLIKEIGYVSPIRILGKSKTGSNMFQLSKRGWKYLWMIFTLPMTMK